MRADSNIRGHMRAKKETIKNVFSDKFFLVVSVVVALTISLGLWIGYMPSYNSDAYSRLIGSVGYLIILLSFFSLVCSIIGILKKRIVIKLVLALYLLISLYFFIVSSWAVGLSGVNFIG